MAEANFGDQRNETRVEEGGVLGLNGVNSSFTNTTINIVQQPALRRDSSTTGPLDEDVASFLARLSLNKLSDIFRSSELSLEEILKLNDDELKEIGVDKLKHRKLIREETKKMRPTMVVISSTGGAAQHQGEVLGQFEYDLGKGYYEQSCTDKESEKYEPLYLYPDNNNEWFVNNIHGESSGYLYNPTSSKTLPTSGWRYFDGKTFHDDPNLTITSGPLPSLCRKYTVNATGAAAEKCSPSLGVFTRTEGWWQGRPVYTNTEGWLLHHGPSDDGWVICWVLGYRPLLRGSRSHPSPDSEENWTFWTGSEYKPASVTVRGSY